MCQQFSKTIISDTMMVPFDHLKQTSTGTVTKRTYSNRSSTVSLNRDGFSHPLSQYPH